MATKPKAPDFTREMQCGHCGNRAPMKLAARYSQSHHCGDEETGIVWNEGCNYELLECPACEKISFRACDWSDMTDNLSYKLLYPATTRIPLGLPKAIQKEFDAALKVRNVSANAYGVLMGRVLEMVCEDRCAKGDLLHQKLADLATKGEIPQKLVAVAHNLKNFRNVGAHAGLGELTQNEVPILEDLSRAILEYVYTAPFVAEQAEKRLRELKEPKKKKPGS